MSGWAVTPPPRDHSVPTTGTPPEEEVGQAVDGPAQLLLDAVHDDRGVGRDGPGVVGHEEGAAGPGDALQPFPLRTEPVGVDRVVDGPGELAHPLAAAPAVDVGQPALEVFDAGVRRPGDGHQLPAGATSGPARSMRSMAVGSSVLHRAPIMVRVHDSERRRERPEGPEPGLRHAFRALRHRDFALFWSGAFVSSTGMWMQNVTVPFVLHEATGSAGWVGLGAFAQFAPVMVMSPLGGALADRHARRTILIWNQAALLVLALGPLAVGAGRDDPPGPDRGAGGR